MAYSKVERRIHDDERFRRWTRDVRQVWQYLLTTKHGNRLGLFVLDPLYAVADLSAPDDRWTEMRFVAALDVLAADARLAYDPDVRLVLLFNHLEHNAPENPNVVKGALSELAELPFSAALFPRFLEAVREHCRTVTEKGEPFAQLWIDAVEERIRKGSGNGSPKGSGNGMPNPEPEPEPEPELRFGAKAPADEPPRDEPTDEPGDTPHSDLPLFPAEQPESDDPDPPAEDPASGDPLAAPRGEAARLIRAGLWKGERPPATAPPNWSMGRDLSVWRGLLKQFTPEELNGGLSVVRRALREDLADDRPITMAFFNSAGKRDRMSRCVAYWRQQESRRLAADRGAPVSFARALEGLRAAS
jgi:hypothetical protein